MAGHASDTSEVAQKDGQNRWTESRGLVGRGVSMRPATVGLNNFRIGTDGVQGNQVHGIIRRDLEVQNLDF